MGQDKGGGVFGVPFTLSALGPVFYCQQHQASMPCRLQDLHQWVVAVNNHQHQISGVTENTPLCSWHWEI